MPGIPAHKLKDMRRSAQSQREVVRTFMAPIMGLNTKDPLQAMDPRYSPAMQNWVPEGTKLVGRKGSERFFTGTAHIAFLHGHDSANGKALIVGEAGKLHAVTDLDTSTTLGVGYSDDWVADDISNSTLLCNGIDAPKYYNPVAGLNDSAWTTTDISVNDLNYVHVHGSRAYFLKAGSQDFYYGPVGGVQGALTEFQLSLLGNIQGNMAAIGSWTVDAGDGADDRIVFVSRGGSILIYSGTNPGDADNFALVGRFQTAQVIGRKPLVRFGPDLLIMTAEGFISLQTLMQQGESASARSLTDNIKPTIIQLAATWGTRDGWEAVLDPGGRFLVFNVPRGVNTYQQFAYAIFQGGWFPFRGWDARSWAAWDGKLWFGTVAGKVYEALTGYDDDGSDIEYKAFTAWTNLGIPGGKALTQIRPVIAFEGEITVAHGIAYDFDETVRNETALPGNAPNDLGVAEAYTATQAGPAWDTSDWDTEFWGQIDVSREWHAGRGEGTYCQYRLAITEQGKEIQWIQTDVAGKSALPSL